ncbi:DUF4132 domain-containing protein [Terrimonas sp. NA20]|uniref:DUF4132 domain-containing protein n=1 Tax=Terrimonas ginsenosidimutans TaxID=2908004 RepID=A0ABS9KNB0_9BACT|nr:DUF4132 domain-containing protein [Terrimonas ginsenosidimutans]MCG2613770.1 DUF4132 domain-containing protein [Terrimonas ginsenosidimutans]
MAFTLQQVDETLKSEIGTVGYGNLYDSFHSSDNYNYVMDYLTGRTNTLASPKQDVSLYVCVLLLKLLEDIENPSANDRLIIDLVQHPYYAPLITPHFISWLYQYAIRKDTVSALNAVQTYLSQYGMNSSNLFSGLMQYPQDAMPTSKKSDGAVKAFLTTYLQKSKQLPSLQAFMAYSPGRWTWSHFHLIEEVRPDFIPEYIRECILADDWKTLIKFIDHKEGAYLSVIAEFLKTNDQDDARLLQKKLDAAFRLYELSPDNWKSLVTDLAKTYLTYQINFYDKWEYGTHFGVFNGEQIGYLKYSSFAYLVLLTFDRISATTLLDHSAKRKIRLSEETFRIIHQQLGKDAFPYMEQALLDGSADIDLQRELINLLGHQSAGHHLALLWKLTSSKPKAIKELVAQSLVAGDPDAEQKAISLLKQRNADSRHTAALILSLTGSQSALQAIRSVLDLEKNDNTRDVLLEALAATIPAAADQEYLTAVVEAAKLRGRLEKPAEEWMDEAKLPALFDLSGNQLNADTVRFLFYRMSRVKTMRSDIEVKPILQIIDRKRSGAFASSLMNQYMDSGAKADQKYALALTALLGDDPVIDKIKAAINRWIDESRWKMAEMGIGALALQGSDKALRWVEWYSRKYKNKKANVGAAALTALETAAEELGISTHELGDRIVPDFGFDGLFRHFTIEGEEFRAFIDSKFKIAFFNDDNKKLKAIPASASAELKDEFKAIAKEVRDIVKSQSPRLEYYLQIQRKWTMEQWEQFFLRNPVMFIYATKILWGVYDEKGKLVQTFLCNEDTSLIDVNSEEISLNENALIGIIHPTELEPSLLHQWKQLFFDLSIDAVFPQLERLSVELTSEEMNAKIIRRYDGKKTVTGSIRSTLERFGWRAGPALDGGMIDTFYLIHTTLKLEAMLKVEGVGAGFGWTQDESLGPLFIVRQEKIKSRYYYHPKDENDEALVTPKDLPPIFLSEMLAAVEAIKLKEE